MKSEFHDLKIKIKKLIKHAVFAYEKDLAKRANTDPKLVYSYINSKRVTREEIRAVKYVNGVVKDEKLYISI